MTHIVLLGDSIFDNRAYTGSDPDVVTHLRSLLPAGARATLLAVDGATTASILSQVDRIPPDATHLVVSIGGNDALGHADLIDDGWRGGADPLRHLASRLVRFEADYRRALRPVFSRGLPTTTCTIYNGALPNVAQAERARIGLMLFNDVIIRVGVEHAASMIELRLVCCDLADYANPIEPSGPGGLKIAEAITRTTGLGAPGEHAKVFGPR